MDVVWAMSYFCLHVEVGEDVGATVAQGFEILGIVVVVGARVVLFVAASIALSVGARGGSIGGGGGVGEATAVGYFALLAVVAGPLAIALGEGGQHKTKRREESKKREKEDRYDDSTQNGPNEGGRVVLGGHRS